MTSLKRHLAIILSILMFFTMCPTTIYASTTAAGDAAALEITEPGQDEILEVAEPEQDVVPDEVIVDETESITEEILEDAFDETAPTIEETVPESVDTPDTEEYEDAKEPASPPVAHDITQNTDEISETEELVGAPVTVGTNVTATFNSSTGEVVLTSKNGTLWRNWIEKSGFDRKMIKSIRVSSGWVSLPADSSNMFNNCTNLKTIETIYFDTSEITNAFRMFSRCNSLESLQLYFLDTTKCTDMSEMFRDCYSLTELGLFEDTSNVTSMSHMFAGCKSLKSLYLRNFNTSKVLTMEEMFSDCESLTDLDLSSFNTPNLESVDFMFSNCSSLVSLDMSGFDLTEVGKTIATPFRDCTKLKVLKTPKRNTYVRSLPVTLYDQNGKSYSVLPTTTKSLILARPKQLTQGTMIVGAGVTASMDSSGAVLLYSDNGTLSIEWTSRNPSLQNMTSCKVAYGTVYLPADSGYMFSSLKNLRTLDLTNFNTSRVTDMSGMFSSTSNLERLDLSMFDTSKVTNISYMFYWCSNLKILDLSSFNLSNKLYSVNTFLSCGLQVLKTPKRDKTQTSLMGGPYYDSSGKEYTSIPNLSKSIVLTWPKQLAKDYEKYGRLFTDVLDPSHPYYKAIYWAAQKGITKGYSDGSFGIDLPCTRGHAVMFLWRMAGCPAPKAVSKSPFSDVPKTHTFYKAVLWAQQKGITYGYTSGPKKGTFGINDTCTRGQIMTFIWRYKGKPKPKAVSKSPFSDVPMNHAFYKAILWAYQNKVTNGYTTGPKKGKFGIDDDCTRGQIVTFLYRIR